jgi:hypothetical protein
MRWPGRLLALFLIPCIQAGLATAGAPEIPTSAVQTITIVLEGAQELAPFGPSEIQVRIFEGEDPDAPPQVTTLAAKTVAVERLSLPMAVDLDVPVNRLAASMRPMVGVLVLEGGNMVLWNDAAAPLARSGSTVVALARVP